MAPTAPIAYRSVLLNSGLSKAGADEATATQLQGFATGTYPFLGKLDARRFTRLLSAAEIAIGGALVLPVVPLGLAGAALTAFALGTLGLYLRTTGLPYHRSQPLRLRFSPTVPANEESSSYIATGSIASIGQGSDHTVASQHLRRPEIA